VFRSDDDEWINVGTSCFRDFVGITPATVLWLSNAIATFDDDDEFRPPKEAFEPDLTTVLRVAATITAIFGFVRSAEDGATKWAVADVLAGGKTAREITEHHEWADAWATSETTAEAIKTWVLDKAENGNSDFIANAALAIRANRAAPRTMGLLASLPFVHAKAMGEIAERDARRAAAAEADAASVHVGEVGDKMVIRPVTIVRAIRVETRYGTSVRVTGITEDGNKVTTFGSGDTLFGVDTDDIVEWRGSVHEHNSTDEFGDETEFKRVKLLDLPSDVDFTRVASKGDRVKVALPDGNRSHDLAFPRETPDGWVFDVETRTLWATVEKVGKRDGRFVYTTNAPVGFFAGADIEVTDEEFPVWRMNDIEVKRELRHHSFRGRDAEEIEVERRFRVRKITKFFEERGVEVTDALIAETIARYETLTTEEETA
jgi:hypothetical protein